MNQKREIEWGEILAELPTLESVQGGNSSAKRGFVMLDDGTKLFVKIGVDEYTKAWAKKEITAYDFLTAIAYPHCPNILARNDDVTGFAIDALTLQDGWDWSDTWNEDRLAKTLEAMDVLAEIRPESKYEELFREGMGMTDVENGWVKFASSKVQQEYLQKTFGEHIDPSVFLELEAHQERSLAYKLKSDTLCHHDVRADNCAYNSRQHTVQLVDWNWLQMGDKGIDIASFLVHVHQNGIDVTKDHQNRLDSEALHWIAGFWFDAASKPIWEGGPKGLRQKQLRSACTAFSLALR